MPRLQSALGELPLLHSLDLSSTGTTYQVYITYVDSIMVKYDNILLEATVGGYSPEVLV